MKKKDQLFRLDQMSIEQLQGLRSSIDDELKTRRAELQSKITTIDRITGTQPSTAKARGVPRGTVVPPKYRGPNGETWAGRGARPRWLVEALKNKEMKLDDFKIAA